MLSVDLGSHIDYFGKSAESVFATNCSFMGEMCVGWALGVFLDKIHRYFLFLFLFKDFCKGGLHFSIGQCPFFPSAYIQLVFPRAFSSSIGRFFLGLKT